MSENILSSNNPCSLLQNLAVEVINNDAKIKELGITALAENIQDIEYQIQNNLKKQGICLVVVTPELSYIGINSNDNTCAFDAINFTVQIVEYTAINRAKNKSKFATALDIGCYLQELLGGKNSPAKFGRFCPKSVEQGEDDNLIVVQSMFDVSFITQNQ